MAEKPMTSERRYVKFVTKEGTLPARVVSSRLQGKKEILKLKVFTEDGAHTVENIEPGDEPGQYQTQ